MEAYHSSRCGKNGEWCFDAVDVGEGGTFMDGGENLLFI